MGRKVGLLCNWMSFTSLTFLFLMTFLTSTLYMFCSFDLRLNILFGTLKKMQLMLLIVILLLIICLLDLATATTVADHFLK